MSANNAQHYETPRRMTGRENNLSLEIVRLLDGLSLNCARQVLRRAEFFLDVVTTKELQLAIDEWANHPLTEKNCGNSPSCFSRDYVEERKKRLDLQRESRLPPHSFHASDSPPAPSTD
jgi:hypothetical protein